MKYNHLISVFLLTFLNNSINAQSELGFNLPSGSQVNEVNEGKNRIITIRNEDTSVIRIYYFERTINLEEFAFQYADDSRKRLHSYDISDSNFDNIEPKIFDTDAEIIEKFSINIFLTETDMFRHYFFKQNERNTIVMIQGKFSTYDDLINKYKSIIESVFKQKRSESLNQKSQSH